MRRYHIERKKTLRVFYSRVVIILFSVGFKSEFCTYSHVKLGFYLSVFCFFVFLYLSQFIFLFYILNLMSSQKAKNMIQVT